MPVIRFCFYIILLLFSCKTSKMIFNFENVKVSDPYLKEIEVSEINKPEEKCGDKKLVRIEVSYYYYFEFAPSRYLYDIYCK